MKQTSIQSQMYSDGTQDATLPDAPDAPYEPPVPPLTDVVIDEPSQPVPPASTAEVAAWLRDRGADPCVDHIEAVR